MKDPAGLMVMEGMSTFPTMRRGGVLRSHDMGTCPTGLVALNLGGVEARLFSLPPTAWKCRVWRGYGDFGVARQPKVQRHDSASSNEGLGNATATV